jgi:hypothetical protein
MSEYFDSGANHLGGTRLNHAKLKMIGLVESCLDG